MSVQEILQRAVLDCARQCDAVQDRYDAEFRSTVMPAFTQTLGGLFEQRQAPLDTTPQFWGTAILASEAPTRPFANALDQKMLRQAVESVRVTTTMTPAGFTTRRLTVVLRPTIFVEGGELYREISNARGAETEGAPSPVVASGVKWRVAAPARENSMLRVFDPAVPDAAASDIMDAFDQLFQDPFVFDESDA
jgi:hypothetical protein